MFESAITANQEGVKGLEKIRECNKIYAAIEKAIDKDFIYLESSSFKFLKQCMEAVPWVGGRESTKRVEEAFTTLENSEEYDPNQDKVNVSTP